MSQELERVYTIPLGKVLLSANTHRAVRAINMIKEFARRHMKTYDIKIDEEISHIIWARGVRSPPRKIRVKMTKTEEGHILVSTYQDEVELSEKPVKEDAPKVIEKVELEKSEEIFFEQSDVNLRKWLKRGGRQECVRKKKQFPKKLFTCRAYPQKN